ncbi:hypothetical protein B0J14DRAFT_701481 [Halenospora varia]|nr:hypothetical protein B0J14DRAFT_701481 [Halenospora varia]
MWLCLSKRVGKRNVIAQQVRCLHLSILASFKPRPLPRMVELPTISSTRPTNSIFHKLSEKRGVVMANRKQIGASRGYSTVSGVMDGEGEDQQQKSSDGVEKCLQGDVGGAICRVGTLYEELSRLLHNNEVLLEEERQGELARAKLCEEFAHVYKRLDTLSDEFQLLEDDLNFFIETQYDEIESIRDEGEEEVGKLKELEEKGGKWDIGNCLRESDRRARVKSIDEELEEQWKLVAEAKDVSEKRVEELRRLAIPYEQLGHKLWRSWNHLRGMQHKIETLGVLPAGVSRCFASRFSFRARKSTTNSI